MESRGNTPGGGEGGEAPGLLHFKKPFRGPFRIESLQGKRNINEDKIDQADTQQHMTTCSYAQELEEVQDEVSLQWQFTLQLAAGKRTNK